MKNLIKIICLINWLTVELKKLKYVNKEKQIFSNKSSQLVILVS